MASWQLILVLLSGLAWPVVFIVDRVTRLPEFAVDYVGSLVFAPMGLIAGWFAVRWMGSTTNTLHRLAIVFFYLAASPLAFWGALGGGMLHPIIGPAILGALPLVIGAGIGHLIGRAVTKGK
jgi:hypothetical protein